jgi:tartrate dehydratase beta subunit/fumarate hydratase class I family protein
VLAQENIHKVEVLEYSELVVEAIYGIAGRGLPRVHPYQR